jgi:hypothetical protein
MPTAAKILAQSLENAVSSNDLNYILLKRKDGNRIPALHPRDSFTIFAMLDKFLGGDGLLAERLQFWTEDGAPSIIDDQKFDEILAATPSILRYYLARLHRKTKCYSKSLRMLKLSLKLLIHKFNKNRI